MRRAPPERYGELESLRGVLGCDDGGPMRRDQAARVGAVLASLWLVALTAIDIALPPTVHLVLLSALAPLMACAVLPALPTALFGAVAVGLTILSGWWNQSWGTAQQWVRLLDVILVSAAAVAVAAVRVRRERRLERLTTIAETAQRAILPTLPQVAPGVSVAARYLSAAQDTMVGGDLYDCCQAGGYTRFVVGDVRGKGIAAVEQAARVIRAFRQAAATKGRLSEVASDMNSYLAPFLGDEEFVTALLADLVQPDVVTLISCGHPPALFVPRRGPATLVEMPAGLPLGIDEGIGELTMTWQTGDRLLLYTDGLSEARDATGEFLSVLDLAPLLASTTMDEALDQLLERVRRHVPGGGLGDDLAVMLLENGTTGAVGYEDGRPPEVVST